MPIEPATPIAAIGKADFHRIDERMLGHAFAIHRQYGRLLDESIYKAELAHRCTADGMPTQREVRIRVHHGTFAKDYFIDLLLCGSTIIEAKTAIQTQAAHQGQGINYLLLAGTHHGSLVNFRPSRVVRRFLSTRLTPAIRRCFEVKETNWPNDEPHAQVRECLQAFCTDVGLGLDLPLYREAVTHLIGCNRQLVPVLSGSRTLGHQEMTVLRDEVGLAFTALLDVDDYRHHLQRLVSNTPLAAISWVNLRIGEIQLESVRREGPIRW